MPKSHLLIVIFIISASMLPADNMLRVGCSLSLSSGNIGPSEMLRNGYRLWADKINEEGGLLGRQVELLIYDDEGDPDNVRFYYEKLINEDGAELLLAPYGTPLTLTASEVSEAAGMVMITSGAAGNALFERGYRYIFGMYAPAERFSIGFLDICAREGFERVAVVYETSPFHDDVADGARKWGERFGMEIAPAIPVVPGETDLNQLVQRLMRDAPDALFVSMYPETGLEILSEIKTLSYEPSAICMTILPTLPDFLHKAGPAWGNMYAPSQWEPRGRIPYPGTVEFINDYEEAYNTQPSYYSGSAYASCRIISDGFKHIGSLNHDMLRMYISLLDTVTIVGRFKTDSSGKQIGHNPLLIQWQNGKKEIVYPRSMMTADPVFE
ncbi:MAG: amino acid ABC transporter substrate-binding protein [Spirochaetales bacterium]|uniref:Amino acid ABC transporter substrate-binding protein n=1 Tax=Candidatus Thalassospirochaeta sargassi TaxID=3119039 RepID=A0AAJ1IHM5_9SPIO|nr:amino acid ABC transporter substrate-binding protein [Spirochaetales bacterium]